MSYLLLWQLSTLVGLIAFWVTEFGNVSEIKQTMILAFSGRLIPLWLFPDVVGAISRYLPFQYTFQAPLEIYIGRTSPSAAMHIIAIQAIWVVLFTFLVNLVWRRAQRRVFVQGG